MTSSARLPLAEAELVELYERYGFLLHRRCALLLGDAVRAQDVVQEVFLRIQRLGARPRDERATLPWLYTIAFRCCADASRAHAREEPVAPEVLAGLDDRRLVVSADRLAAVLRALQAVSVEVRSIGLMYHFEGLTQDEIAEQTGRSRRSVGRSLRRFGAQLGAHLVELREWSMP